jgi:hypothetical protein
MKKYFLFSLLILMIVQARAQELNCQVTVNAPKLEGTDRRVYDAVQKAAYEFMNNRKWTNYNFKNEERIDCTILITINNRLGSDEFQGTLNLVLRRPVMNAAYSTNLLNYVEKDFQFKYVEFQPMDYSEGTFTSNLTSVLAFYAYMTIGFQFDSFSLDGGRPFFDKAQAVVNAAQNAQETGWKGYEGTRNRYWFVENMENPSNSSIHDFLYKYHRLGLDQMYDKLETGRASITESLDLLKSLYNAKPDLYVLTIMLDAKRDELVNIYSDQKVPPMEKATVTNLLKEIDPANGSKYQTIQGK